MQDTHASHHMVPGETSAKEYFKLAGVIGGILLLSIYMSAGGEGFELARLMRWFMGLFFVTFATFKFIGYEMFVVMFPGYDIVAKRLPAYAYAYPFIELSLGTLYLLDLIPVIRDLVTIVVMFVGAYGVWQEIKRRRTGVYCACLGNIIKLPLSTVSFVEDVGMGTMALAMLVVSQSFQVRLIGIRTNYRIKWFSNPWLSVAIVSSVALQLLVIHFKPLANVFSVAPISGVDWLFILIGAFGLLIVMKLVDAVLDRLFASGHGSEAPKPLTAGS